MVCARVDIYMRRAVLARHSDKAQGSVKRGAKSPKIQNENRKAVESAALARADVAERCTWVLAQLDERGAEGPSADRRVWYGSGTTSPLNACTSRIGLRLRLRLFCKGAGLLDRLRKSKVGTQIPRNEFFLGWLVGLCWCAPSCVPSCLRSCVRFVVCSRVSCPGLRFCGTCK